MLTYSASGFPGHNTALSMDKISDWSADGVIFRGNVVNNSFDGGIFFPVKNVVQVPSSWRATEDDTQHISPNLCSILMYWVPSSVA